MSLPILQGSAAASNEGLIRLFHRAALDWSRHLGEETALNVGTAICNPELATVSQANRVFDAMVPEGMAPDEAVDEVELHFEDRGSVCGGWVLNPSAPPAQIDELGAAALSEGYTKVETDVLILGKANIAPPREVPGLTIIPARASFKHYRELAEHDAVAWKTPKIADASLLHLDDPRYDALLAIHDGKAVATIGVLSMGEAGVIEDVLVLQSHRGRGIGRIMLARALEICARSSFKHVMLDVDPSNPPAVKLYHDAGFVSLGKFVRYLRISKAS